MIICLRAVFNKWSIFYFHEIRVCDVAFNGNLWNWFWTMAWNLLYAYPKINVREFFLSSVYLEWANSPQKTILFKFSQILSQFSLEHKSIAFNTERDLQECLLSFLCLIIRRMSLLLLIININLKLTLFQALH